MKTSQPITIVLFLNLLLADSYIKSGAKDNYKRAYLIYKSIAVNSDKAEYNKFILGYPKFYIETSNKAMKYIIKFINVLIYFINSLVYIFALIFKEKTHYLLLVGNIFGHSLLDIDILY